METLEAVERFLVAKKAKGLAQPTMDWYAWLLHKFAAAYPELPDAPEPIEQFIADVVGTPETRHAHFRAVRTMYNWLHKRRVLKENPMFYVEGPRVPRKVPRWLELHQAQSLYQAAQPALEKALIRLLLDTGIRIGEAAKLDRAAVHSTFIIVTGKVGQRVVPISSVTADLLLSLPISYAEPAAVFAGTKGRYHIRTLQRIVGRCFDRAGLSGRRSSPHTLRHTFGTLWDGHETILQGLLGHADISTTRRYRHFMMTRAVEQHRIFSPMAAIEPQLSLPL